MEREREEDWFVGSLVQDGERLGKSGRKVIL